jgi:hypothetical protein
MTDQNSKQAAPLQSRTFEIFRKIVFIAIFGLVAFTAFMAAGRKFGWF